MTSRTTKIVEECPAKTVEELRADGRRAIDAIERAFAEANPWMRDTVEAAKRWRSR